MDEMSWCNVMMMMASIPDHTASADKKDNELDLKNLEKYM